MQLFKLPEAKHYCSSFTTEPDANKSLDDYSRKALSGVSSLREGTDAFIKFRSCSLRNVERYMFLAAANYRSSLDLMTTARAPWAYVTMYYGTWYSAHALLGMFGGTVLRRKAVSVEKRNPGQQELSVKRIGKGKNRQFTTGKGSHQIFWDLFYRAMQPLRPQFDPRFSAALAPVGGDHFWQAYRRNEINYDPWRGLGVADDFRSAFSKDRFPGCLSGAMGTQYSLMEALVELAFVCKDKVELKTDAMANMGTTTSVRDSVKELVYGERPPGLVRNTKKSALI